MLLTLAAVLAGRGARRHSVSLRMLRESIRDADVHPEDYYPQGYQPELLQSWPADKPVFIPADKVPPCLKLKP